MANPVLEIRNLHTYFFTREGVVKAVNGVSLALEEESILGVVGESGSGKTITALSIVGLVPFPGRVVEGSIRFDGRELVGLADGELRKLRGKEISLVFQDAQAALNPVLPVGQQVEEVLLAHTGMGRGEARGAARDLLAQMGVSDPRSTLDRYPFQLSGGMAQRVILAIAVAMSPRVLIADEPTSNLDVTLQAEVLLRLRRLREEHRSAMLLITHDLGVIAQMASAVSVMCAGSIVEHAPTIRLFHEPRHPYTWGLLHAVPRMDAETQRLRPIRGSAPRMLDPPDQCVFLPRCAKAIVQCRTSPMPPLEEVGPGGHLAACYNPIWDRAWRAK